MKLVKRYYNALNKNESFKMALAMAKMKDGGQRLKQYFSLCLK